MNQGHLPIPTPTGWPMDNLSLETVLTSALRDVGVANADTVLVHSDSTLSMELSDADWWDEALAFQLRCFQSVLGAGGTLVVPTFNYDFCEGGSYDHDTSPSQVGLFSSFILNHPESVRSFHPIFSFAAIGPRAHELCDGVSLSSFGADSVFDRLNNLGAGMVFFNVSFEVCTFVHHVEQIHGVDYRFLKDFSGEVTRDGHTSQKTVDFFVRYLDREVNTYFGRLEQHLAESGTLRTAQAGSGVIKQVRCTDVYREAWRMLDDAPYGLLKDLPG